MGETKKETYNLELYLLSFRGWLIFRWLLTSPLFLLGRELVGQSHLEVAGNCIQSDELWQLTSVEHPKSCDC